MSYTRLRTPRAVVPRAFYDRAVLAVAPELLGMLLVRREDDGGETVARIVETEAYREDDPASHSFRGRTDRNAVMFGPPGHLYVYFTYGMHFCMNVSCEPDGTGAAVLLRAAAVLRGHEHVRARRAVHPDRDLLRGPARLTQGLAVGRGHNGLDVTDPTSPLRVEDDGWRPDRDTVLTGPRTGIRVAVEQPWRFWLDGVPEVSRHSRHPRAWR
ncbi:MAG TPA: DNA-3-methyladenine glycosylase [Nitriliruptorales bacterium]|nr:DNA-3-methyladenine glycosylase [Nitriliruptorales bacterium]